MAETISCASDLVVMSGGETASVVDMARRITPWSAQRYRRLERDIWTWHMRRFGDPGIPVQLAVQMSVDGLVREVYIIDESDTRRFPFNGVGFGFGF